MKISREVLTKEIFEWIKIARLPCEKCAPQSYKLACSLRQQNYDIADFIHYFRLYDEITKTPPKDTLVTGPNTISSRIVVWADYCLKIMICFYSERDYYTR